MTERYTIFSETGDEYRLQFTTDRSNIIADRILDLLLQDGIEVVEVGLGRVGSTNVTSHRVLQRIEESIADFMTRNPNAILSYMCDFINLVPSNKKITVQEYRSRMFSAMFKRYMSQHHIADIFDDEIKIDGVAETFYFHVIYHKKHEKYAKMIADGHHEDLDKPE